MKMLVVFVILVHVSQHASVVELYEGEEFVLLPCEYHTYELYNPTVVWRRYDLSFSVVHQRQQEGDELKDQNQLYSSRTSMMTDALETGHLSLNLTKLRLSDSGTYTCTVRTLRWGEQRVRDIELQVKVPTEQFPSWAKVLLVLLVLLVVLGVSGGLLFHFRQYFMSVYRVEVDSGVESVQLPCKTTVHLPEDVSVEWTDGGDRKVHVYQSSSDQEQHIYYRGRKVDTVEVDSEVESVQLPCKTTVHLPEDISVKWTERGGRMVHVYQSSSDQPREQYKPYRGRTEMKRNLETGDFSLTLKYPTDKDTGTYTCTVYSSEGQILRKKQVILRVKVDTVEVDSEVESVQLPCKTTVHLPEDISVKWTERGGRMVHVYQSSSDQPREQYKPYRGRTEMKRNLETGDFSLTLKYPTDKDTGTYTCTVYSSEGQILMKKQVILRVKVDTVEVDSEVESVQLPCKTTVHLPEDISAKWTERGDRMVHVYQSSSDQPREQYKPYRGRTEMKRNLETGDFSLTLKYPTDKDRGTYTCTVYSREGQILMKKGVYLWVKACQVEVKEGAESVQLPFKTTGDMPEDTRVEWKRFEPKPEKMVHLYENGSDRPEEQHEFFRDRTEMKDDLLRTGDISLILKSPRHTDTGEYRCSVDSKEGKIWRMKIVKLNIKERTQIKDETPLIV